MERIRSIYDKIVMFFAYISIVFVFVMMLYITLDVLIRNFTNSSLVGTYEIVQYFIMPISVFLSIPYAYTSGVMPKLVLLVNRFKNVETRKKIELCCSIIGLLVYLILSVYSFRYAIQSTLDSYSVVIGTSLVPAFYVYYLIPLAFILMSIGDLININDLLRKNKLPKIDFNKVE